MRKAFLSLSASVSPSALDFFSFSYCASVRVTKIFLLKTNHQIGLIYLIYTSIHINEIYIFPELSGTSTARIQPPLPWGARPYHPHVDHGPHTL